MNFVQFGDEYLYPFEKQVMKGLDVEDDDYVRLALREIILRTCHNQNHQRAMIAMWAAWNKMAKE